MISIIKWTLWQKRYSIMWWSIAVIGFILLNLVFYPTFKDQAAELDKSLSQLPESAKALFAGSSDFASPVGYLNSQIFFLMLPMLLTILTIGLGSSIVAKEEREGTIELLLARPVSRNKLLLSKSIASIVILIIVSTMAFLSIAITIKIVDLTVPIRYISIATLSAVILALCFGSIAFMLTMLSKGSKAASIGIATFIAFGGYIIASLSTTVDWLKTPSKVFPAYYYKPEDILRGNIDWRYLLFPLVIIIISAIVSWWSFNNRDIGN